MATPVYIRLKQSIFTKPSSTILLQDIARVIAPDPYQPQLEQLVLHQVTHDDRNIVVVDALMVIEQVIERYPQLDIELIGPNQCVVHIEKHKKQPSIFLIAAIWLLLFVGASMAIMNFHYDVSMQSVQQKLHFMLTGEEAEHPLWIQVPYSIGLGVGMILFFNHWFQKRFNEEPSPMEVEIFNYQEDLDHYVAIKENKVEKQDVDH